MSAAAVQDDPFYGPYGDPVARRAWSDFQAAEAQIGPANSAIGNLVIRVLFNIARQGMGKTDREIIAAAVREARRGEHGV